MTFLKFIILLTTVSIINQLKGGLSQLFFPSCNSRGISDLKIIVTDVDNPILFMLLPY